MSKILIGCLILLHACTHYTKLDKMKGSYDDNINNIDPSYGWAFYHEGNRYYFALALQVEGDQSCAYYVGFKNDRKEFFFPGTRLKELNSIYERNLSLEEKVSTALKRIEEFNADTTQPDCKKYVSDSEQLWESATWTIAYMGLPLLGLPVVIGEYLEKKINNFDRLRLGMNETQVQAIIGRTHVKTRIDNGKKYHIVDRFDGRVVMYFENGALNAWVRGR